MKPISLIIFFISISITGFSQNVEDSSMTKKILIDPIRKQNENNLSIGIDFCPNYSSYKGVSKHYYPPGYVTKEKWEYGYKMGITIKKNIKKHIQITTGLYYNRFSFSYIFKYTGTDTVWYEFVAIPIQLQYNYTRTNYAVFFNLGFELNHLNYARFESFQKQYKILPFGIVTFGLENKLYKKLYSSLGIGFQYSLLPYNEQCYMGDGGDAIAPEHFYSCFIKTGLAFKF